MSDKIVLVDGHSILHRAFYGVPDLSNEEGFPTNAIYGFLNIVFKILEEEKPKYLAVAFDVSAPTFRHQLYKEYKGTRKPMPEELLKQVPVIKELLKAMNIAIVEQPGLEADDILGTLAKKAEADKIEVSLVSGDRDLLQVATEHIKIRIPKTKMGHTEIEDYYAEDVKNTYQVTPIQFIELKALMGDASDNIPGVPKVGEKTATALMTEYGSLDNIYAHVEEISKKSIRESLKANRELADLSKTLATIKVDCNIELDYEKAKAEGYYTKEAYSIFKRLGFKNWLEKFEEFEEEQQMETARNKASEKFYFLSECKQMLEILKKAEKAKCAGILLALEKGKLLALSLSFEEQTWFYGLSNFMDLEKEPQQLSFVSGEDGELGMAYFAERKENPEQQKLIQAIQSLSAHTNLATFDIKKQYNYLQQEDISKYFDILIGAYLLNPLKSDYTIEAIAEEHLEMKIPEYTETFGKLSIAQALQQQPKKAAEYLCYGAYIAEKATLVLRSKLKQTKMEHLMEEIEMPLSLVLYDMEKEGVMIKPKELKEYGDALVKRIQELETSIHKQAGKEFNINSPKQLGEILFDTLKLPGGKKTKTGYSTAADILEKLAEEYPIVKDILEYRGLTKLKSTYADGLAAFIESDQRIHTNFNQTITATGRISSTEPNLQNIPMRMELGRRIRKVFVPKEGCVFMDADYSQIELRILAHLSGDKQLIEAYRMEQDIHRITAAKVFHTPFEEVTDLQRRNAKAVNFGIVYGISSFGLSQDLSISKEEAAEYIEQYFVTYPKVKEFLDQLVENAKKDGYTTTMFGRRRPIPQLSSAQAKQQSFGERIAMNSPIQGTAADIIKIAMIKVWRALKEAGLKSKLILQVHDELLIETVQEEKEIVQNILIENMQKAADMAVTLEVDLHIGENWYEAK